MQQRLPKPDKIVPEIPGRSKGQVLVIFALMMVVLALFVGLAVDAGSLYVTYGQLKRAVDASAVSAANNFKRGEGIDKMKAAASEILTMHGIDMANVDLDVYICDAYEEDGDLGGDGLRDESLQTLAPEFYKRCPVTNPTGPGEEPRKLVWVDATQHAPLYFMSIADAFIDIDGYDLRTNSIAEAAQVDVVVVLDISESMGVNTTNPPYQGQEDDFDPDVPGTGCNELKTCMPLEDAKDAAVALVEQLYEGYDRIGIVTFDSQAVVRMDLTLLTTANKSTIETAIGEIKLHDDPSPRRMPGIWQMFDASNNYRRFNPVNPEDRDGHGDDVDALDMYGLGTIACDPDNPDWQRTLWDTSIDPYGWSGTDAEGNDLGPGVPCDLDDKYDTYDWNKNGIFNDGLGDPLPDGTTITDLTTQTDDGMARLWLAAHDPDGSTDPLMASLSPLSTCTGCGLRVGSNLFKNSGRPNAVWVMIVLSDGVVNLSDTPETAGWTAPNPAVEYKHGFCQGSIKPDPDNSGAPENGFWQILCLDLDTTSRYCVDTEEKTCPPDSIWGGGDIEIGENYSVMDYAMDMVDEAALTREEDNQDELLGNNIAIYSVYLDNNSSAVGEYLLRYMADVGDDGQRGGPCETAASSQSCGQYYYAPNPDELVPIFEDIASRIYTRITQ